MLRISWTERTTDERVLERLGFRAKVANIVKTRKLKYFGHLQRHDTQQRRLMEGRVDGRRPRGRPRKMWVDNIAHWTGRTMTNIQGRFTVWASTGTARGPQYFGGPALNYPRGPNDSYNNK